jgi:hypothetical protein
MNLLHRYRFLVYSVSRDRVATVPRTPEIQRYPRFFSTLGQAVEIPFRNGRKSGTSIATTITAGIAALVLDFATQYIPETNRSRHIWSCRGMKAIFLLMASQRGDCNYLEPWALLSGDHAHATERFTRILIEDMLENRRML